MKIFFLILLLFLSSYAFSQKHVAITFDDLPSPQGNLDDYIYITDGLMKILNDYNVNLTGFANEGKTDIDGEREQRVAQLKKWIDNGHDLGNHTYSHPDIGRVGLEEYEKDIIKGEPVVKKLMSDAGKRMKYFRHPFLYTGKSIGQKDSLDNFLKEHNYIIAPVTIDNSDWVFAHCYYYAMRHDEKQLADSIVSSYVEYMGTMLDFFESLSQEFLGREIKHTLLVHANLLNADHFDKIIDLYKNRGYEFISLDEALTDPAYSMQDAQMKWGRSWIHRWMIAKGMEAKRDPDEPKWILDLYEKWTKK